MKAPTHFLAGAVVALPLTLLATGLERPVLLGVSAVAALLPDIDHPYSPLGRLIPWPKIEQREENGFVRVGRVGLTGPIWHRDQFHSTGLGLILGALFYFALQFFHTTLPVGMGTLLPLCFVFGYWSHLLLDTFSPTSQMLFWPLSKARLRPPIPAFSQRAYTGAIVEFVCFLGSSLLLWRLAIPLL